MPNSGTVTAGSAALASQYNNLRDDVLNTSTGHTHTGASENGAKVHGTALDSTGASNGQVLTANGSGGVTFAAAGGAGALSTLTGSAAFSTAASGVFSKMQVSDTTNPPLMTVTGGGTVVIALMDLGYDTGTHAIQAYYPIGGTTIQGSSAVAPATAGTVGYQYPVGYGFSSGTAFVIREAVRTSAGTQSIVLRKFNQTLSSNMWNATIYSAHINSYDNSDRSLGPLGGGQERGPKYEPSIGIWYGGDYRNSTMGTGDASRYVANIYVINDASGSVYSAPFGSAQNGVYTYTTVYVPGIGTAAGTIHAWGYVGGTETWAQYTVGSASITAVSTATYMSSWAGGVLQPQLMKGAFWHSQATAICFIAYGGRFFTDRTGATAIAKPPKVGIFTYTQNQATNGYDGAVDRTTGWAATYDIQYFGTAANQSSVSWGTAFGLFTTSVSYESVLVGAGSATHIAWSVGNGQVSLMPIAGTASIAIGSAATGRIISFESAQPPINVQFSDGFWLTDTSINQTSGIYDEGAVAFPKTPAFVLPAGASAVVTYRSLAWNRASAGSVYQAPYNFGTALASGAAGATATVLTSGGSVSHKLNVISLS